MGLVLFYDQYLRVDNEGEASARGHHRPHLLVCEVRHEAEDGEDHGGGEHARDGVGDGDQDSVAVAVAVKPAQEQLEGNQSVATKAHLLYEAMVMMQPQAGPREKIT